MRSLCRCKHYSCLGYTVLSMASHSPKKTKTAAKQRYADLDFLRIAAMFAVIIIHCSAALVLNRPFTDKTWLAGNIIDSSVRWAVPIFVMVSGALLIGQRAVDSPDSFLKRRLHRVLVPFIIWTLLYLLLSLVYFRDPLNLALVFKDLVAGNPSPGHLYFLPLIAGLYVITPLISLAALRLSKPMLWRCALGILAATAVWHALEVFVLRGGPPVNILTQWMPYVGYYLLGHLLLASPPAIRLRWLVVAFVGSIVAIVSLSYLMTARYNTGLGLYFYNFPTPFVMVLAASVFVGGRRLYAMLSKSLAAWMSLDNFERYLSYVSASTFGIYLVHIAVLSIIAPRLPLRGATIGDFLILVPTVTVLSFLISVTINRIPAINKLLIP
jgi:surface polysaccharide O-acyltransferase-like enzyme